MDVNSRRIRGGMLQYLLSEQRITHAEASRLRTNSYFMDSLRFERLSGLFSKKREKNSDEEKKADIGDARVTSEKSVITPQGGLSCTEENTTISRKALTKAEKRLILTAISGG